MPTEKQYKHDINSIHLILQKLIEAIIHKIPEKAGYELKDDVKNAIESFIVPEPAVSKLSKEGEMKMHMLWYVDGETWEMTSNPEIARRWEDPHAFASFEAMANYIIEHGGVFSITDIADYLKVDRSDINHRPVMDFTGLRRVVIHRLRQKAGLNE